MKWHRDHEATQRLVDTVWNGRPPAAVPDACLARELAVATRNHVQGLLAAAHPTRLAQVRADVSRSSDQFHRNLGVAVAMLRAAGVQPVLIKADLDQDFVYTNFDFVVGADWDRAVQALRGWFVRSSGHPLEPDKILLHPRQGPSVHLHRDVAWFGVPVIRGEALRSRARVAPGGWVEPSAADQLRTWVAHAVFQNLSFDLSELMSLRSLLTPSVVAEARALAKEEGWLQAFDRSLDVVAGAFQNLDAGQAPVLPTPLPMSVSIAVLREHVPHLHRVGERKTAVYETFLRVPLLVVKRARQVLT